MQQPFALVTGAADFIGSQLVRTLLARGERVKALVSPGSNLRALQGLPSGHFELAVGDVRIEPSVYAALAGCSRMYHAATNFKMWDPKPERIVRSAVDGTRAVLCAAQRRKLDKVVITSGAAVLGATTGPETIDESHAFNLEDPEAYFAAKVAADRVADEFCATGLPIVRVLPATIVGPQDWEPTPSGRLLLEYLKTPASRRFPVFGGGISIVDIEDVANGHALAMDRGAIGESFILGGDNLTFTQIFQLLRDLTGLGEPSPAKSKALAKFAGALFEFDARLRGGQPRVTSRLARDFAGAYVWLSSQKAETQLGYTHRSAREALARSVRWFLANGYVPRKAAARVRLELRPV